MTRQSMFQAKKESQPLKTSSLFRRQAAQAPVEEREAAALPVNLGRDFSGIPFKPVHPAPALGPSSISCPFTPQRCPFGGACHACPPKMQAKLKIGQPGDKYEQEADRVAEQVMRMPEPQVQRKCSAPGCKDEEEKKLLQTKPANAGEAGAQVDHPLIQNVLSSPGQPLDAGTRSFMEPRFGQDFSGVRVHVGGQAAESARAVNARAYTVGRDVVFGVGQYAPGSDEGKRLVAHELVHVGQQRAAYTFAGGYLSRLGRTAPYIQRAVRYDILDWGAAKLIPPTLTNGSDPRTILIPPTGQISISALVDVLGDPGDACSSHEIGTTQTAWVAWTIMYYRGETAADGRVTVRHRAQMPMRDPSPAGAVWYDPANIQSAASCGTSVSVFHRDSPWHNPPKARNNGAVVGNPLVYLEGYRRGLHLVTYLTARDAAGNFLRQPLRFRYWNSIQSFDFTPQYPTATSAASFLGTWPVSGEITVNIGSSGRGEVSDAPYYTTTGDDFNTHFNNFGNWTILEQR